MTKLCARGKAAAKRKFRVYPSAYANAYASKICAGKIKDPSGTKRKDFKGPKPAGAKVGMAVTAGAQSALGRIQKARMMNKGGGADTGTMGERKSKLGVALQRVKRTMKKDGRLTRKDIEFAKETLKFKKMNKGGGMNNKRDIRKTEQVTGKQENKFKDVRTKGLGQRAVKKGILRKDNSYSSGGLARGGGAAIRGTKFEGIF